MIDTIDYKKLFEKLPGNYILLNIDKDFTVVDISDAHELATGRTREQRINKPIFHTFFDAPTTHAFIEALQGVVKTKQRFKTPMVRYDMWDKDGNFIEKYWELEYTPIFDRANKLVYILQGSIDITDFVKSARKVK